MQLHSYCEAGKVEEIEIPMSVIISQCNSNFRFSGNCSM